MAKPFVVTPDRAAFPLNIVGEQVTVLASGAQTGGYEIFLQVGPEGGGPPPPSVPGACTVFWTKGETGFRLDGGQMMTALRGALVHRPAGTTHWVRRGSAVGATALLPLRTA